MLAEKNLIVYLGHKDARTPNRLRGAILALLDDPEQRQRLAVAGTELVDGLGSQRVVALMTDRD